MDSSIVKKTQDTLGKVISKPPLTEKLLSKPPFRFLHDIITEVIKKTNVLKGLFKSEELNSENVKVRLRVRLPRLLSCHYINQKGIEDAKCQVLGLETYKSSYSLHVSLNLYLKFSA